MGENFKHLEADIVRNSILDTGKRIDGRDTTTVRQIIAETSVLPRTHGSALFTRGETQALVVTTLGTGEDEQYIDSLDGTTKGKFMLHYNFPPFSVGEVGRMGATGRREIGHGKLAWRAINPLLPKAEDFPYTVRVVSEITESNGSSSMATVCGASLALMDAGVPMKAPCAGIAMGLIKEGERFAVLSDILIQNRLARVWSPLVNHHEDIEVRPLVGVTAGLGAEEDHTLTTCPPSLALSASAYSRAFSRLVFTGGLLGAKLPHDGVMHKAGSPPADELRRQLKRLLQGASPTRPGGWPTGGRRTASACLEHQHEEIAAYRTSARQPVVSVENHLGAEPQHLAVDRRADPGRTSEFSAMNVRDTTT